MTGPAAQPGSRDSPAEVLTFGRLHGGACLLMARDVGWLDCDTPRLVRTLAHFQTRTHPDVFHDNLAALFGWYLDWIDEALEDARQAIESGASKRQMQTAAAAYRGRVKRAAAKAKGIAKLWGAEELAEQFNGQLKEHLERMEK